MNDKVKVKSIINTSEGSAPYIEALYAVSYTHLRAHET